MASVAEWLERNLGLRPRPAETFAEYPLSGNSPELHAILSGQINVASDGLPSIGEREALSIPAFSRGVEIIAGTIATLPLKTYRTTGDDTRVQVPSIFDAPQGPFAISTYQWTEMVMQHLVMYREAFLHHVFNDGGALVGYWPIHPGAVTKVEWAGTQKVFTVHAGNQSLPYGTPEDPIEGRAITHILGPGCVGGLRGTPIWESHRRLFQIAVAAERATAKVFTGALIRGLVTTAQDEDVDETEATAILEQLNQRISGPESANQIAFVNRHLVFDKWQQTNADAQFIESRTMQIEEFARVLGVPPHLLAAVDKQTSWGTGVSEQNIGLSRYTLGSYTSRFESSTKPLNESGTFQEFDYKGLLQGSPAQEIELLLAQVAGGILDVNEARRVLNLPPKVETDGDEESNDGAEDGSDPRLQ